MVRLEDDQGVVGLFSFEGETENLLSEHMKEILDILSAQSTVALRNAELYSTIPSKQIFKNLGDQLIKKIHSLKERSWKFHLKYTSIILAAFTILFIVKIPHNISANIELLPYHQIYYSEAAGKISNVHVQEGQLVHPGTLLAELDVEDHRIELKEKQYRRQKIKTEMLKYIYEEEIANYKIKESELLSLDYEIDLLKRKIESARIMSDVEGHVISEDLDALVGMPVNFGQEVIKVATSNQLIARFQIPEAEVAYVRPEMGVTFKVYGHPMISFSKDLKLNSVSGEARAISENDPTKFYLGKSQIPLVGGEEETSVLRPGMTGRGKIHSDWQSVGKVIFSKLINFFMMEVFF